MAKLLIINSPYYKDISDAPLTSAQAAIERAGHTHDTVEVPGALEIPAAIKLAANAGGYDAYVALGCVVRGETAHFDYVCGACNQGLMDLATRETLLIGNGVLTVESQKQAMDRADGTKELKGTGAAEAAIALLALKEKFQ